MLHAGQIVVCIDARPPQLGAGTWLLRKDATYTVARFVPPVTGAGGHVILCEAVLTGHSATQMFFEAERFRPLAEVALTLPCEVVG